MAQQTVTVTLADSGPTSFVLTVPVGSTSLEFMRGIIKQRMVTPGDGVTVYPIEQVASMVASAP